MTVDAKGLAPPLEGVHEEAGARFHDVSSGPALPRHYGDPAAEYDAAMGSCAVTDRSHRSRWRIEGRDPASMLDGIVTNTIPPAPEVVEGWRGGGDGAGSGNGWRLLWGRAPYGLTLTPKGKVISDHRLLRLRDEGEDIFLLDLPATGVEGMRAHFERFLPPRFAAVDDVTRTTGMLSVVGPQASSTLDSVLMSLIEGIGAGVAPHLGGMAEKAELTELIVDLEEDEYLLLRSPSASSSGGDGGATGESELHVLRSGDLGPAAGGPVAFDVVAGREWLRSLWDGLTKAGCAALGRAAWETLRVEGGRPAFGIDMDDSTIPVEAGVHDRAIDYEKGCYTGQEVIVRIRDLGRVNRHLRRLLLGDRSAPSRGTVLFGPDGSRKVGWITSAVESPRFGQVVALGYVRRELEPPARVRLESPEGPLIEVRSRSGEV